MEVIDKLLEAPLDEGERSALRTAVTEGGNAELAEDLVRLLQQYAVILEVTPTASLKQKALLVFYLAKKEDCIPHAALHQQWLLQCGL